MLSPVLATWIARLLGVYLLLGIGFAFLYVYRWVNRMDPVAAHGTPVFRLFILPGSALLWPLLLRRVRRGDTAPRMERTAHRRSPR